MPGRGSNHTVAAAAVALAALSAAPRAARAQQEIPFDTAIDVQLFEYAPGSSAFLTVPEADVIGDRQFAVDFLLTFLTDPFTIYDVDATEDEITEERTEVVSSVLAGQLAGAYGWGNDLQLNASLPMIFSMSGEGLDVQMARAGDGLQATGLGDLRVELKWRFLDESGLRLAVMPAITVPTSVGTDTGDQDLEGGAFLGDDLPTGRLRVAGQWSGASNAVTLGGYVGAIFRKPREVYSSEVGQQLVYGAGANVRFTDSVDGVAEVFGRSGFNADLDASPVEVNGGVRVRVAPTMSVLAGGGAGIVRGIGSPGLRVFASFGWSPDYRDSDDDGVPNQDDRCPLEPEDKDGFEDRDGCPDPDNDGDLRDDATDRCPLEAEDKDGFEDDDGCPEIDNDGDGVLDANDQCPDEAEVINGVNDFDGCPDAGGAMIAQLDGDRIALDNEIDFDRRDRLNRRGAVVADQIAAVMLANADVAVWRIVVGARTRASAQARADALKAHLVSRGVPAERVEAIGAASDDTVTAVVVRERRSSDAGPICPAGAQAVPSLAPPAGGE